MPIIHETPAFVYYVLNNDRLLLAIAVAILAYYLYRFVRSGNSRLWDVRQRLAPHSRQPLDNGVTSRFRAHSIVRVVLSERFWSVLVVLIALVYLCGFLYYSTMAASSTAHLKRKTRYKVGDLCSLTLEYPVEVPLEPFYRPGRPISVRFWVDTHQDPSPAGASSFPICSSQLDPELFYAYVFDIGPMESGLELTDQEGIHVPSMSVMQPAPTECVASPETLYLRQTAPSTSVPVTLTMQVQLFDTDGNVTYIEPEIVGPAPVASRETWERARGRHLLNAAFTLGSFQWIVAATLTVIGGWRIFSGIRGRSSQQRVDVKPVAAASTHQVDHSHADGGRHHTRGAFEASEEKIVDWQAPMIREGQTERSDPVGRIEPVTREKPASIGVSSLQLRSDLFVNRVTEQRRLGAVVQDWREQRRKGRLSEQDRVYGLTGETGIGKTWLLRSVAQAHSGQGCYPIYLDLNDRYDFPSPRSYVDDAISRLPHRPRRGEVDTILILDHVPPSPQDSYLTELQEGLVLPQLRDNGCLILMALTSPAHLCWTDSSLSTTTLIPVSCFDEPSTREQVERLVTAGLARNHLDSARTHRSSRGNPLLNWLLSCYEEMDALQSFLDRSLLRVPSEIAPQIRNYLQAVCTLTDLSGNTVTHALGVYHSHCPNAEGFPTTGRHVCDLLVRYWLARTDPWPQGRVSLDRDIASIIRGEMRVENPELLSELEALASGQPVAKPVS